jgi:hypothetical protein
MRTETFAMPSYREQPPLTPYDPPQPAPQALAWQRALKVVGCVTTTRHRIAKTSVRRDNW